MLCTLHDNSTRYEASDGYKGILQFGILFCNFLCYALFAVLVWYHGQATYKIIIVHIICKKYRYYFNLITATTKHLHQTLVSTPWHKGYFHKFWHSQICTLHITLLHS